MDLRFFLEVKRCFSDGIVIVRRGGRKLVGGEVERGGVNIDVLV